ncbi:hypothetical protein RI129_003782 [Pyrocoelia pectoralis]|uniref:CN hydrolase domain-containing protein n=1 Tax=Pyrocoelia pectoralis TaxID=417401 RepID=A0AAN7ZIW8_9COLE
MQSTIMYQIFAVLLVQICVVNIYGQDTYKAAVVEFAAKLSADTLKNRVLENKEEFNNYIEDAAEKHVDIILFPEYGLTGMDINTHNIDEMSTEVPNPNLSISPCIKPENYSKVLVDLSCAAKTHSMYVVINLSERVFQNGSKKKSIYHNTNVVFNREGNVIGRYRKMNLYNESYFTAGNQTVTFKTDFGVTFGVIICKDILFQNSSLNVLLDDSVTDVLYSAAWSSELPFFGALTVQHGYAVANGVNLLASGYDNPSSGLGGSGIYFANGSVADIHVSGAKSSKMIIADVPKSHRKPPDTCQNAVNMPERVGDRFGIGGMMADINEFRTAKEDMSNYTFISLNLNQTTIYESVCDTKGSCCFINITVSKTSVNTNHVYKLAVFNGGRYILTESIGVRVCSLVACQNVNSGSCGERNYEKPNGVIFDEIFLKAIFNVKNAHDRPATLNYNLEPINNYRFCRNVINKTSVAVTISAKNQTNLLTFGIHGRVFENDNKGAGSFNSASFHLMYPYIVLIVSSVVFLLQN